MEEAWRDFLVSGRVTDYLRYRNAVDVQESSNILAGEEQPDGGNNIVVTGMVLQVMPIGEYDKRITLLTKERGKITAFARGSEAAEQPASRSCQPFCFGEFELFEGRSAYTLARATIQNYFRELTGDFDATYYGFYFLEFADYYCQENNDEREMLKLFVPVAARLCGAVPTTTGWCAWCLN